jgi:hypothetical protein
VLHPGEELPTIWQFPKALCEAEFTGDDLLIWWRKCQGSPAFRLWHGHWHLPLEGFSEGIGS